MRDGKKTVLVINGPNLNLLGTREPHIYGHETFNWEGAIVDKIQEARTDGTDGIVINPGGFTHTSVAIRDALLGVEIPFIELHVSNVHAREEWRHHSYFSDKAKAIIVGCGAAGYGYSIEHVVNKFPERPEVSSK
ncbi:hypothetical protein AK830_g4709 [Neonectria ditissima]|uniref:Catabolic 3-dehydroquinase n=1 Tax=Neonectria ditissima TaxID=78410 RepID=A0A0P7BKP8_9HYPO|nr:hypothetical protein AK830_g4709 [Neonectria ditissima]